MINTSVNKIRETPRQLTVALLGIGGFGENYLRALLDENDGSARLVAGVDPEPQRCGRLQQLKLLDISIYPDVDALFDRHSPDLVVIASPAHLHKSQGCAALAQGSHVLCEKPAATTLPDARAMQTAQAKANRTLAIGYQWSFSPTIQALKEDVMRGLLGRPVRLKSLVLWPRDKTYYRRNAWAGRILGSAGEPICDSPVSNGCAHYLHNMLYILGEATPRSIWPESVECEIYRANDIASFDTAVLRVSTSIGAELFLVVSHATTTLREPTFHFEFEDATATYDLAGTGRVVVRWKNGTTRDYGALPAGTDVQKLWITLKTIRDGGEIACGIAAALPHVAVVSATQQCQINPIPQSFVRIAGRDDSIRGLGADLTRCYDKWAMPSELGLLWSRPKQLVAIPPPALVVTTNPDIVRREHLV
jgi:predicted dehydrogenase